MPGPGERLRLPAPGEKAPAFALEDQAGKILRLADLRGKWVLLYFYPKDDTPGCTREACGLRDNHAQIQKAGAVVVGISVDDVRSHAKFAKKYDLPFRLVADPNREVVREYGVWGKKKFMGRVYEGTHRVSFLIDPKGRIAKVYPKVRPDDHAAEVLADLRAAECA